MILHTHGREAEPPIVRRPAWLVELPLSPQQRRWWFLHTRYLGASSPIVGLVHRFRGPLVVDAWLRAVGALVDRHEGLRALFVDRADGPVQVIGPPRGLAVERVDLRHLPGPEREKCARELLEERRAMPLDLERGPLVASSLLRLDSDDHVWSLTMHHILSDGASLAIIGRELGELYRAFVDGTEPALADLPIHYPDYAVWLAGADPPYDEDRQYWLRRLAGVPPLDLPTDWPRPVTKGAPAAEARQLVGADLARRMEELARTQRCTRFMVLLAALQMLLARRSGQHDFCIGIPVVGGGRARSELASVVGPFNNALALRCDLSGDPTFRELLAGTREAVIDALDHQDLPFSRVVDELRLPHDPGRAQVFQVLFVLDEFEEDGGLDLPDLCVEDFALGVPKTLHDLMVYAWPSPDGLWTRFIYDTGLFAVDTMSAMVQEYERLLRAAVDNPDARLSELTLQP